MVNIHTFAGFMQRRDGRGEIKRFADFPARSKVLEIVYAIACDIHPVNNLRVLRYLSEELKVSEEDKKRWYAHFLPPRDR